MQTEQKTEAAGEFIPTRETLLSRLKDLGDNESWRTFFETYWKLIYSVALKAGLRPEEAQDVVQETVVAVVRNIGAFRYDPQRCAFKTWLMQVTRSRISNQFRRNKRHRLVQPLPDSDGTALIEEIPDPAGNQVEALWDGEWQQNLMDAAIQRIKQRVDAEQFQIFDFYVLRQWPVGRVAETFGVSVGKVYLVKHRISKLIRKEVEQLEAKEW
jgi:RNA polymerase sigma factor (sigma-70 family)